MSTRTKQFIQSILASSASVFGLCAAHGQITASWLSPVSGTWTDPTKWSTNPVYPNNGSPNPADTYDVVINPSGGYVVALSSDVTVNSISMGSVNISQIWHTAGTLQAGTISMLTSGYRLQGGTINNAYITGPAGTKLLIDAYLGTSTLDGVTLAIDAAQQSTGGTTVVRNGLTLRNSTVSTVWNGIKFDGTQIIEGTGTFLLGQESSLRATTGAGLTIGSSITVRSQQRGYVGADTLVNRGTLESASSSGGTFSVFGTQVFHNEGWIKNSNNGYFAITNLDNTGTITLTGGSTVLWGDHWTNDGTMSLTNGTLQADGTFTAATLSSIVRNGTVLQISGCIDNADKTLALDCFTGAWPLMYGTGSAAQGTVQGGTVGTSNGSSLVIPAYADGQWRRSGTFDNVTLAADVEINRGTELRIRNGINLNSHTIRLLGIGSQFFNDITYLDSDGNASINGVGSIIFDSTSGSFSATGNNVLTAMGGGKLTIGPGVTVTNGTGFGQVGSANGTWINQGTITATSQLEIQGNDWINQGTITVMPGATLRLNGTVSTANIGQLRSFSGQILAVGTINNAGQTLVVGSNIGTLTLSGSQIRDGTITTAPGYELHSKGGSLVSTTLVGDLILDASTEIKNTLTLSGGRLLFRKPGETLNGEVSIYCFGAATINGSGEIVFNGVNGGTWPDNTIYPAENGTITIGSGVYLRSGTGDGACTVINQGTISAETNHSINLRDGWINQGVLDASVGTVNMSGSFSTAQVGTIKSSGSGSLLVSGTLNNAGSNWSINGAARTVYLTTGACISGGSISTSDGARLKTIGTDWTYMPTLSGTTINGDVEATYGYLRITNGLAFAGGNRLLFGGNASVISFVGSQTISGSGEIVFESPGTVSNDGMLTISPGVTIRTGASAGTFGLYGAGFVNHGTISAQTEGKLLRIGGPWTSDGALVLAAGTLNLGGTFSAASLATLHRSAGSLVISGYLNNTSSALNVGVPTGNVILEGGVIAGGTVAIADNYELIGTGTLSGVVLSGAVRASGGTLMLGSMPLHSGVHLAAGSPGVTTDTRLVLAGSTTLSSGSDIRFDGGSLGLGGTLTLEAGTSMSPGTASGTVSAFEGATIGLVNRGSISAGARSLVFGSLRGMTNEGTIIQDGSAGLNFYAWNSGSFAFLNTGTVFSSGPGSLSVLSSGVGTNSGVITSQSLSTVFLGGLANIGSINANGGTVLLATGWSSTGTLNAASGTFLLSAPSGAIGNINAANSYLSFAGNFSTSQLLSLNVTASTFNLASGATLNNSGETIQSNAGAIRWQLGGGVIRGGTLSGTGSLAATQNSSTLDAVTLQADVIANGATLTLANLPAFTGRTLYIANNGTLIYSSGNQLAGPNTINIVSGWASRFLATGSFTLGADVVTKAGGGLGTISATSTLTNYGTISAEQPGGVFLSAPTFTNYGAMRAINGSALGLYGSWNNLGTITIDNGVFNLGGVFTLASIGSYSSSRGVFNVQGTCQNAGNVLLMNNAEGYWVLDGGTISSGTIAAVGNASLLTASSKYSTLSGVTLAARLTLDQSDNLTIYNGLVLSNGIISMGGPLSTFSSPRLTPVGSQTISGTGTILLNGGTTSTGISFSNNTSTDTLTLGPGIVVQATSSAGFISTSYYSSALVIGQGTISAVNGGTLQISGRFSNQGVIEARNGGFVHLQTSTLTNLSSGALSAGTWAVYGNSTLNFGTASITTNNANIILDGAGATMAAINSLRTNPGQFTITNDRDFTSTGTLTNSGTIIIGPNSVLRTNSDLFNSGSIDLAGGVVLVDYPVGAPENANLLPNQIDTQVYTSSALANPALRIGFADNSELGAATFAGQAIDASTMILMMTFAGDSNLDGAVNTIDFNRLAGNFGAANTNWLGSDFNYDHTVDSVDFTHFLSGYGQKLPAPSPELGAIVPEPAAVALFTLWLLRAAALCRRPARRRATNLH
jgi:filamentous hemagglutinin